MRQGRRRGEEKSLTGAALLILLATWLEGPIVSAQTTPPPLGPAIPAFRPVQPGDKDQPVAAGEIASADELLAALEKKDKSLRTFAADVLYDKRASKTLEKSDRQRRTGSLYFEDRRIPDSGGEPKGAPGDPQPDAGGGRLLAIVFNHLEVSGPNGPEGRADNETYIVNKDSFVRKEPDVQQIFKYALARKDGLAPADPLRLGEGPFPIPIGQRKDDVLARFSVELRPGPEEIVTSPENVKKFESCYQLRLIPKPGTEEARQYRELRVWYYKATLLPRMARSVETDGSMSEFQLAHMQVNQPLPDGVFDISVPAGWAVEENEFRRQDR
jgi:outer membrane lipoprotein-sorting protein